MKLGRGDFVDVVEVAVGGAWLGSSGSTIERFGEIDLRTKIVQTFAEVAVNTAKFLRHIWQVLAEEQNSDDPDDYQFLYAEA